jgi:hypothetical protein
MHVHRLLTFVALVLSVGFGAGGAQAKGILEILRDKGVITEAEYKQALEEARGQEKKAIEEVKAEATKETKIPSWLGAYFRVRRYQVAI